MTALHSNPLFHRLADAESVRAAYRELVDLHGIDAIVLVDGGTDILMRGDEAGLGTPEEDLTSVAALAALDDVPERLVVSVGFGVVFLDAVADAQEQTPDRPSIVNGSIAAAVRGSFGDVQFTSRTRGSELFVNPLMSLCFAFDLPGLAARCLYLDRIEDTHLMRQVHSRIAEFREEFIIRPARRIPH